MDDRIMPVVPLRGMTVLPEMLIPFDVIRRKGIAAIEKSMQDDQEVFLVAQRDSGDEEPGMASLYSIGTIAVVKQMLKLPGNVVRVLAAGKQRAVLLALEEAQGCLVGRVRVCADDEGRLSPSDGEAMFRCLREIVEAYINENDKLNKDAARQLLSEGTLSGLVLQASLQIPMNVEQKQDILEAVSLPDRFGRISAILSNEIEVLKIKKELQSKVRERVDKNQKEYIMREQLKVIREELGETDAEMDADNYEREARGLEAPEYVRDRLIKEIERFRSTAGSSAENAVARGYIETLLSLPWDKRSDDKLNLREARRILERDHYGLTRVKDRMLEFLAVRSLTSKGDSPIICLVGPPGTGKTSIARSVAEALGKKYVRICLGGVRDEAEIRGHRRTYVGALPGRIITGLRNAGVRNPLMLLDEIDKISSDYKGDTSSALLEVLDSEQNSRFVDHYAEIPVDLSEVMFIATANSTAEIQRPLLDRMEIIEVGSYTLNEKLHIAKEHLFEKQLRHNGLRRSQLSISDKAYELIITGYTKEAGVRGLERRIGELCRKAAREILEKNTSKRVRITEKNLEEYLGRVKFVTDMADEKPETGIVRGLAWTSVGGDTLSVEVNTMPGKGSLELTGKLGDVMKESARTGVSYIRSVGEKYGIADDYFEKHDLHIHIPEGAVPKDGPSAGITMASAMLSAITGTPVKADLAMTGEITLRGRVLAVGGLKEKLLAARTAGIKTVIIPEKNRKDIEELDGEVKDGLELCYVNTMNEVMERAFVSETQI